MHHQDLIIVPNLPQEPRDLKKLWWYQASPYSGDEESNVVLSVHYTNELLDKGYFVFNPLTHSHRLDQWKSRKPSFWYNFDLKILERLDGIIMCGNWHESKGCRLEYDFAKKLKLVIREFEEMV